MSRVVYADGADGLTTVSLQVQERHPGFPVSAILAGLGTAVAVVVAFFGLDHLPVRLCTFKIVTGHPCMSCGSTRAAAALARLEFATAFQMNPLTTLVGLGLALWAVVDVLFWTRGRRLRFSVSSRAATLMRVGIVAAVLVNWAYLVAVGR